MARLIWNSSTHGTAYKMCTRDGRQFYAMADDIARLYEQNCRRLPRRPPTNMVLHGTYCGPETKLKGQTALIFTDGPRVMAQFDNLKEFPKLAHGWHVFPRSQFSWQ